MAKNNKPLYRVQTGDRGHQAPGIDQDTHRTLAERGLIKSAQTKPTHTRASRKASKASKKASKKTSKKAPTRSNDLRSAHGFPSRSRRKIARQSRHFRFPLEVDAKLQDLVDYYDGTMTYVMSRLIHEEWVRTQRKARRAAKDDAPEDSPDDSAQ